MAASADVKQLLLQVDASVSLAQRNLSQLAAQVQRETTQMETNLERPARGAEQMGQRLQQATRGATASLGQMRAASQQLAFQIGDISQGIAMGVRPMTIFAQQSGQVVQALTLMGGTTNRFLTFLGGPWGAGLTGAALVMVPLISRLFDTGSEVDKLVDKMREQAAQARNNAAADEVWRNSIEGVIDALRKRRLEQEKALQTDASMEREAVKRDREALLRLERQRNAINQRVSGMLGEQDAANAPGGSGRISFNPQQLQQAQAQLAAINSQIASAQAAVRDAERVISERTVTNEFDAVKAATDRYTQALRELRQERRAGLISQAEFERGMRREEKALKDAKDSAAAANRGPSASRSPAQVLADFQRALRDQGVTPGSGYRSQAHQDDLYRRLGPKHAARFSQHTTRRAQDVPLSASNDQLEAAAAQAGLRGFRIQRKPNAAGGPHAHTSWTGAGDAGDSRSVESSRASAEARRLRAIAEEARIAEEAARNLAQFNSDRIQNEETILQARIRASGSITEQAELEHELLRLQRDQADAALQERRRRGELTDAQFQELRTQQGMVFAGRHALVIQERQNRLANEQLRQFTHALGLRQNEVQGARDLARTQAERRVLEMELIDIAYRIREAELRRALATEQAAGRVEEAARIQDQINALPGQRSREEEGARRGTMNPLEEWADSVPRTAAEVNEALQTIQAQGLQSIEDGLTGVIMGTQSLGDAFKNIANAIIQDIIRMTIRMLIFQAISKAMGGAFGGGGGGPGDAIVTGLSSDPSVVFGKAGGGAVFAGVPYQVGERGREVFVPKTPGTIIPNHALGRGGGREEIVVRVVGSELLDVQIERTSGRVVATAAPHIVKAAANTVSDSLSRPRLS